MLVFSVLQPSQEGKRTDDFIQYIIFNKPQAAGDMDCMTTLFMTYWGTPVILQMSLTVAFNLCEFCDEEAQSS